MGQIDWVGAQCRGLAVGIDEGVGCLGVALSAQLTSLDRSPLGLCAVAFCLSGRCHPLGILSGVLQHAQNPPLALQEQQAAHPCRASIRSELGAAFGEIIRKNPQLSTLALDGQINKWADTLMWGTMPLYVASHHVPSTAIGLRSGLYSRTWSQTPFGPGVLSGEAGRKFSICQWSIPHWRRPFRIFLVSTVGD